MNVFGDLDFDIKQHKKARYAENEEQFLAISAQYQEVFNSGGIKVSWVDGEVLLHRGDTLVNKFTEFKWVNTKTPKGFHLRGRSIWEDELQELIGSDNLPYLAYPKHKNAFYSLYLGCRPTLFLSVFNACMIKAFVPQELQRVANEFCRTGSSRAYNATWVNNLKVRKNIVKTLMEDNLINLIPLVLMDSDIELPSPQNMKQYLGKSVWKRLASNSKSRNLILASSAGCLSKIAKIVDHPSSLVKYNTHSYTYSEQVVSLLKKEKVLTKSKVHDNYRHLVNDTISMYEQLGIPLPKKTQSWDYTKWKESHDNCTKKLRLKEYSSTKFECLNGLTREFRSSNEVLTANLLDNALDIALEGDSMHHCVGSYSSRCSRGKYMVLSIKAEKGVPLSTLGLYWNSDNTLVLNQHYGYCNATVVEEEQLTFAKIVIGELNKQLKLREVAHEGNL